ncbi:MAG: 2Fe-2S iron-sulfur cluster-binding protein [bacterium]|nr:2Fe-2S iron-sulfur cluster-binding protein [bacterium]
MPRITYVERNGTKHEIELDDGTSVMRGAVDNDVPGIDGDCGGECACGTCHVYVDAAWLDKLEPVSEAEASMLSFADAAQSNSRLCCQIKVSASLDGLIVGLPEGQH